MQTAVFNLVTVGIARLQLHCKISGCPMCRTVLSSFVACQWWLADARFLLYSLYYIFSNV